MSDPIQDIENNTPPLIKMQVSSKMRIAARIADLIKENGWSKSEFASKVNKLPSEVTKWLSGTHNFTIDTLCEIAVALNVNLFDILITGDDDLLLAVNNIRNNFNKTLAIIQESLNPKYK